MSFLFLLFYFLLSILAGTKNTNGNNCWPHFLLYFCSFWYPAYLDKNLDKPVVSWQTLQTLKQPLHILTKSIQTFHIMINPSNLNNPFISWHNLDKSFIPWRTLSYLNEPFHTLTNPSYPDKSYKNPLYLNNPILTIHFSLLMLTHLTYCLDFIGLPVVIFEHCPLATTSWWPLPWIRWLPGLALIWPPTANSRLARLLPSSVLRLQSCPKLSLANLFSNLKGE